MLAFCALLLFAGADCISLRSDNRTNATHVGARFKVLESKSGAKYQKECEEACPPDVDVSCYTECEVALYNCYDNNVPPGGEPFDTCVEEVLSTYQEFSSFWSMANVSMQRDLGSAMQHATAECDDICGTSSNCMTACEVDMYRCMDSNTPTAEDKIKQCKAEAKESLKKLVSLWSAKVVLLRTTNDKCYETCGHDASCVTACEVGVYDCMDVNTPKSEKKIEQCIADLLKKVVNTQNLWTAMTCRARLTHLKGHALVLSATERHSVQGVCNDVCGTHSECVTSCEVDMYACYDENTPVSVAKVDACKEEVKGKHTPKAKKFLL